MGGMTGDQIAFLQQEEDRAKARKSPLWAEAVAYLAEILGPAKDRIATEMKKDPELWWTEYHFGWGMQVRNDLRTAGFGEKEFEIANMDNIYIPLVEEALGGDAS
jgi:hypothetical protein